MRMEYKHSRANQWDVLFNNEAVAIITINTPENSFECEEGETKVWVRDCRSKNKMPLVPGSPFESLNLAKAAIEYHFRNIPDRTEFAA